MLYMALEKSTGISFLSSTSISYCIPTYAYMVSEALYRWHQWFTGATNFEISGGVFGLNILLASPMLAVIYATINRSLKTKENLRNLVDNHKTIPKINATQLTEYQNVITKNKPFGSFVNGFHVIIGSYLFVQMVRNCLYIENIVTPEDKTLLASTVTAITGFTNMFAIYSIDKNHRQQYEIANEILQKKKVTTLDKDKFEKLAAFHDNILENSILRNAKTVWRNTVNAGQYLIEKSFELIRRMHI